MLCGASETALLQAKALGAAGSTSLRDNRPRRRCVEKQASTGRGGVLLVDFGNMHLE